MVLLDQIRQIRLREKASQAVFARYLNWDKPRRVVAKVEWHPGELLPRVGFVVTNLCVPAERVVDFYNHVWTALRVQGGAA